MHIRSLNIWLLLLLLTRLKASHHGTAGLSSLLPPNWRIKPPCIENHEVAVTTCDFTHPTVKTVQHQSSGTLLKRLSLQKKKTRRPLLRYSLCGTIMPQHTPPPHPLWQPPERLPLPAKVNPNTFGVCPSVNCRSRSTSAFLLAAWY